MVRKSEMVERNTLESWVHYMANNPHYFQFVFRVPLTEKNLTDAAVQIFGRKHRAWKPTCKIYKYKPKRAPMLRGVKNIADYLRLSVTQVYFYSRHGNLPTWHEDGKMMAYVGKLQYWMRKRRLKYG